MLLVPCFLRAQIPSYVPTSGLVGWWPFNGNANDESGNGNNGTVNGATLTTDRFGSANKAYSFNGINNNITVNPFNIAFGTNENFSVSLWIKSSTTCGNPNYCGGFLSQMGISSQNDIGYQIGYDNSNRFKFEYNTNSPVQPPIHFYNTSNVIDNNWHIVSINVDKVNNTIYIYSDGVLNNTITNSWIYKTTYNPNPLFFGMLRASDYFYNGFLDDISIHNRLLTQQEITNLYTSSAPPTITITASPTLINCGESATLIESSTSAAQPCIKADLPATLQTGLVGYWPFCGNANDASGNGNNGTVNGATLTTDRFGMANKAYNFDGNDWIEILDNPTLNNSTISVGLWLNTNSTILQQVLYKVSLNTAQNEEYSLPINLLSPNKINLDLKNNSCVPGIGWMTFSSNVNLNNWVHVSFTHDGSTTKFYLNGTLINSQVANFNIANCPGGKLIMGIDWELQNGLNGKLDDIAIYNRALTATEIQQLYSLGNVNYSWSTGATTPSITVSPAQTTAYTCTATNSAGSTTSSVTVTVADSLSWTGLFDTDWHKPCNWSPQFVPKCCNNVAIPLTSNQPIVSGVAAAEDLTIYTTNGAQITVNTGANLQIADCPTTITTAACPSMAVLTTTAVSNITQTTAVSGGTISYQGASAITARGICWSTGQNPTIANSFTSNGTGVGTFTSNLTGLTAGTTYYVRAYATNASGTSYGNEVSFVAVNPQPAYAVGSVFCNVTPTLIVDVTNPTTGKIWMDRNLGATQVATSSTDAAAYGDLYQWGRGNDGHQCRNSATTTTLSATDQPGDALFIVSPTAPNDWRTTQNNSLWQGITGINNPCPTGYRLPTETELEAERFTWTANTSSGAFNSLLKITLTGYRYFGNVLSDGAVGNYWTSTLSGTSVRNLNFNPSGAGMSLAFRSYGMTVRCIKDASAIPATIGALNCGSTTITGTSIINVAASGLIATVPYTGGNGGSYTAQTIPSTGVLGLTATLTSGISANGTGSLLFAISGTPTTSGTASFALTIGGQSCSFTISVQSALVAQYSAGSVFCASGPTSIVDVTSPTGKNWMDRNLGASQAATSSTDANSYGDLYQWGRRSDGHQCRTSATIATLSSIDQPAHGFFILATTNPWDWRSPQNPNLWQGVNGVNNPCPSGYRLPTFSELNAERLIWSSNNSAGAFSSVLKLPAAGVRDITLGELFDAGTRGIYCSSTVDGSFERSLLFDSSTSFINLDYRGHGRTIRCIKD